jgi:hypothetical protein
MTIHIHSIALTPSAPRADTRIKKRKHSTIHAQLRADVYGEGKQTAKRGAGQSFRQRGDHEFY